MCLNKSNTFDKALLHVGHLKTLTLTESSFEFGFGQQSMVVILVDKVVPRDTFCRELLELSTVNASAYAFLEVRDLELLSIIVRRVEI